MNSFAIYLLSNVNSEITGTVFPCVGMKDFTVGAYGTATGAATVNLQARLDEDSSQWFNLSSTPFIGNSGVLAQFHGPFQALRATVSPYTTGSFNVVCRYSNKY